MKKCAFLSFGAAFLICGCHAPELGWERAEKATTFASFYPDTNTAMCAVVEDTSGVSTSYCAAESLSMRKLSSFNTSYSDQNGFNSGNHFFVMDVNGDGKQDMVALDTNGILYVYWSNGTSFVYKGQTTTLFSTPYGFSTGNRLWPVDLNGDGRTDLVGRWGNGGFETWLANSAGTGFDYANSTAGTVFSDPNGWNTGPNFLSGCHG